jgi:hypothetical protein
MNESTIHTADDERKARAAEHASLVAGPALSPDVAILQLEHMVSTFGGARVANWLQNILAAERQRIQMMLMGGF